MKSASGCVQSHTYGRMKTSMFLNGNLVAKMVQTLPNKQEPTASCHQNPSIKVMQGFLRHEDLYKCQSMSGWPDTCASWVRGSKKLHCRWSTAPDRFQHVVDVWFQGALPQEFL